MRNKTQVNWMMIAKFVFLTLALAFDLFTTSFTSSETTWVST